MKRFLGIFVFVLAVIAGLPAFAQGDSAIQLRLINTMTEKVDYYLTPPGGKPTFAGSIAAGAAIDVPAKPGQDYTFAVNRVPFQKYKTRAEVFQGLTLAPQGRQKPPVVAKARQKPLSGAKTVQPAPVVADQGQSQDQVPSEDGLVWTFSQYVDPNGAATAVLVYGLPETDNTRFTARCSAGRDSRPQILIAADVSGMNNGATVSVRFVAASLDRPIVGKVRRGRGDGDQSGVDMVLEVEDILWQDLAGLTAVNYSVQRQPAQRLPLVGLQEPLGLFLRDCKQLAAGVDGPVAGEVVSDATQLFADGSVDGSGGTPNAGTGAPDSCAALEGVVSKNGGKNVTTVFVNRTDEYRVLLWIDFEGMPVDYTHLEPGQSYAVDTSSTHPWMATDGPGNCIEKFMPRQGQIAITRKSPGFGPE